LSEMSGPTARRFKRRLPRWVPYFNAIAKPLIALGVPMGPDVLLTVKGRKSGLPRTTPVTICDYEGRRGFISPFGETNWVRNLRAAGTASIRFGRKREQVRAVELDHDGAVRFIEEVVAPIAASSKIGDWFVRNIDQVDLDNPDKAVVGMPVFEVFPARSTGAAKEAEIVPPG
jgi:deazaflavin-dependent oxidoreductase (nitroreductase family)